MIAGVPIGAVCPFAGQVNPVTGSPNQIWDTSECRSQNATPGKQADAPLNFLEAEGWMLCDGRYLLASSYPELYAVLGSLYGTTNSGANLQFRIPDYRGLFLRGFDAGAGMDPDAANRRSPVGGNPLNVVGSQQCDALQDHTHLYDVVNPSGVSQQGNAAGTLQNTKATASPSVPARISSETRPRNVAVNYIIRFR